MSKLMTPAMMLAMVRTTLVMLSANPVCEKRVQNTIPTDSPQDITQKQFKAEIRKNMGVRSRSVANAITTPKKREDMISKGISRRV